MTALRDRVLAAASVAFGLMWLVAAAAKVLTPLPPYEMVAQTVDPGTPSRALLAAAVLAEVALGTAMVLRAAQGFALSLAGIVAASLVLLAVRQGAGELVPCGCFGDVLGTTLDGALVRNGILAALLIALILWSREREAA